MIIKLLNYLYRDFFSLSEFRDLIFHGQEHRFTLPQIKNCLNELGLKFCGFENTELVSNFRELHGNETDIYDLELWHQFEESKPKAFIGNVSVLVSEALSIINHFQPHMQTEAKH